MEIAVGAQLSLFLRSILLGALLGLLYDLLRAVRRRCSSAAVRGALDLLFGLLAPSALFLFTLQLGDGEPRLYLLIGAVGGGVLFFALCSVYFRPLWDFWVETLVYFCSLCGKPLRFLIKKTKLFLIYIKKVFHFAQKCFIMEKHWKGTAYHQRQGGRTYGKKTRRRISREPSAQAARSGRPSASLLPADPAQRPDHGRKNPGRRARRPDQRSV